MVEDAPVNTGAVQWPDIDSAFWAVRRMQLKLHRWASEDHARRFGDLFNLVYDPAFWCTRGSGCRATSGHERGCGSGHGGPDPRPWWGGGVSGPDPRLAEGG